MDSSSPTNDSFVGHKTQNFIRVNMQNIKDVEMFLMYLYLVHMGPNELKRHRNMPRSIRL